MRKGAMPVVAVAIIVAAIGVALAGAFMGPLNAPAAQPATSDGSGSSPIARAAKASQPLVASGDCQSRFWGKVVASTTKDTQVVVSADGKTLQTVPDSSNLFGFAGLCSGDYTVTVSIGGKAQAMPNHVKLDGKNTVQQDVTYR
jgi:hypothetical protein